MRQPRIKPAQDPFLPMALRLLRTMYGAEQASLAAHMELPSSSISHIESGNRLLTEELLEKYAFTFEITVDDILSLAGFLRKHGSVPVSFIKLFITGLMINKDTIT